MTLAHHGSLEEQAAKARLLGQMLGVSMRAYPSGRMGADDEGVLRCGPLSIE